VKYECIVVTEYSKKQKLTATGIEGRAAAVVVVGGGPRGRPSSCVRSAPAAKIAMNAAIAVAKTQHTIIGTRIKAKPVPTTKYITIIIKSLYQ